MHALVHAAEIQDRDGGALVMATLFRGVSVPAEALRRWRLSGAGVPQGGRSGDRGRQRRDRQTIGSGKGFVVPAAALGRREDNSPGSAAVAGSRRIGNATHARRSPSSASPRSASCSENSVNQRSLFGLTLRRRSASAALTRIAGRAQNIDRRDAASPHRLLSIKAQAG